MKYKFAKQLHNDDEVTVKETGEVVTVISIEIYEKDIYVYAMTSIDGYTKLHHTDID